MAAPNPSRQRATKSRLSDLVRRGSGVFVLHYACQSFYQPQSYGSPRIASIAIRNLANGNTISFSIHQEMELSRLTVPAATVRIDQLERSMLEKYFRFLSEHKNMEFAHWNMRDFKYGFYAIEHRYSVLGGTPFSLPESCRHDMAMLICDIYGSNYLPRPHLEFIARKNRMSLAGFIKGNTSQTYSIRASILRCSSRPYARSR